MQLSGTKLRHQCAVTTRYIPTSKNIREDHANSYLLFAHCVHVCLLHCWCHKVTGAVLSVTPMRDTCLCRCCLSKVPQWCQTHCYYLQGRHQSKILHCKLKDPRCITCVSISWPSALPLVVQSLQGLACTIKIP